MKHPLHSIITVAFIMASGLNAPTTATPAASATIITPISIVKKNDMNFGDLVVSPTRSGTVILSPTGTRSTGGAGGVNLLSAPGSVASAGFVIKGQARFTFSITLPLSETLTNGSGSMTVTNFTSSPASTGTLSATGIQDLKVGATLIIAAGQPSGTYFNSSGVFVTVNYN